MIGRPGLYKKREPVLISSLRVGLLGFEPRQTESKSVVLPLHHNPMVKSAAKIRFKPFSAKRNLNGELIQISPKKKFIN